MKTKTIENPFLTLSFKYDDAKWMEADEVLIKDYSEIIIKAGEVTKTYKPLHIKIKKMVTTVEELDGNFLMIKNRHAKLTVEKTLFDKMKKQEQQKIQVAFISKMDVFNIDLGVYKKKLEEHCATCAAVNNEIQTCHIDYNAVAEKYDERDNLQMKYYSGKQPAIDLVSFMENLDNLESRWETMEKEYDTLMEEWKAFTKPHNVCLANHNDFFTGLNEKILQEKEAKEKETKEYIIPDGIGEQYLELYEKFENAQKSESNIYLDIDEWGLLIDFYHVVNDDERRFFVLDKAMLQHPEAAPFKLRKSTAYVLQHEYQKAIALHKEVEAMGEPYPAALHNSKGLLYDNMKMPDQAIREYEKCIQKCDDATGGLRTRVYLNLALVLKEQKKYQEGIDLLKKSIKDKHHSPEIMNEIAYLYELTGQMDEAITTLENFLKKNPSFYMVWLTLGNFYRQQTQNEKATEAFKKMLELQPGLPIALMSLGETYRTAGNYKEALSLYQQAITNDKDDYIYHFCAGQCLEEMEDFENAKIYYKNAFNINPDFAPTLACLKSLKERGK